MLVIIGLIVSIEQPPHAHRFSHFLLFRTPLHCAASCNNVQVCKFLVESGAAVFATTYSDMQTAAEKCEELEEGYAQCSQFLYGEQIHDALSRPYTQEKTTTIK